MKTLKILGIEVVISTLPEALPCIFTEQKEEEKEEVKEEKKRTWDEFFKKLVGLPDDELVQ